MKEKKLSAVGIILMLLLFNLMSKTTMGYNLIFYTLVLILVYLMISNYKKIDEIVTK